MGQSSNKPIQDPVKSVESEVQLENVNESKRIVEIRSEDVSINKDLELFLYVKLYEPSQSVICLGLIKYIF